MRIARVEGGAGLDQHADRLEGARIDRLVQRRRVGVEAGGTVGVHVDQRDQPGQRARLAVHGGGDQRELPLLGAGGGEQRFRLAIGAHRHRKGKPGAAREELLESPPARGGRAPGSTPRGSRLRRSARR
jgi:hypothetical protein